MSAPLRLLPARRLPFLALLALAAALLWLPPAEPAQAQEDTTRPTIIDGPVITSSPASGDTYGQGETIEISVTFNEAVTVTGEPRVRLEVGERKRWARYFGADGATLTFTYSVKKVDVDDNGIGIGKNSLKPNGGSIEDADGNAARLKHPALADQSGHKVQGSPAEPDPDPQPDPDPSGGERQEEADNTAPTVSSLSIVSTPKAHDSYAAGETITLEATFSEPVFVTGTPCLLINVNQIYYGTLDKAEEDRQKRVAAYASGSGTGSLRFSYEVAMGDRSRKGVGVHGYDATNWPLRLSCSEGGAAGTIRDAADNDADLRHKYMWADAKHKVGGPDVYPDDRTGPTITGMAVVSSPASGDTYRDRETIFVRVTFSEPVVVDGPPRMGIWMGRYRKEMAYWGGSGTNQMTLGYRVRPEDRDGDGIRTSANMILVDGDLAVTDSADNRAKVAREAPCQPCMTTLEHGPLATQPGHKVAGSAADTTPAAVREVSFITAQSVYVPGEEVRLRVSLSKQVKLEGPAPTLEFTIGGETRTAAYVPPTDPSRPWDYLWTFTYTVQEGDEGVMAIPANSVKLPTGAIVRDSYDNLTTSLAHPALDATGRMVPSAYVVGRRLTITSAPAEGDTYRAGETITISAAFNTNVTVTGTPSIGLWVDPNRHGDPSAQYSGGSGTNTLTFSYVVASGITAEEGIATDWSGIQLDDGATIKDAKGNDAYLAHHPLDPQPGHKVDGRE